MASEEVVREILENKGLLRSVCHEAFKAHGSSSDNLFHVVTTNSEAIFSFPGSWEVSDWYSQGPFGATKINPQLFPSLKSIGVGEVAIVNQAFLNKFESINKKELQNKVEAAVKGQKRIVFTGHSSGGPIAILATIWLLELMSKQKGQIPPAPLCVTFGSPLIGSHIFSHALRREEWDSCFVHFVTRHDIVPRLFLAPLSAIYQHLGQALNFIKLQLSQGLHQALNVGELNMIVLSSALTLTDHAACKIMESTNLLLVTFTSFIELSPYRPFGNYVFIAENNKLVHFNNSEAVLQFLFYSFQPSNNGEARVIAEKSVRDHMAYETIMETIDRRQCYGGANGDMIQDILDNAADEFGLSQRGRLCLLAARESEKEKINNLEKIKGKMGEIKKQLEDIESYRNACEMRKVGYYDSFKLHMTREDFNANVNRHKQAGVWDEIIELLKAYKLPEQFENSREWIDIGTKFRRLVEPLDIANYYRHLKHEDTGHYMYGARPKRYRFTQKWLEHKLRANEGSCGESNFLAVVEELSGDRTTIVDFGIKASELQENLVRWRQGGVIRDDVFLSNSTFVKWWESLDSANKGIQVLINGQRTET